MTPKINEYGSREALAEGLASVVADALRRAVSAGHASLAVPGGTTPGPMLEALAAADLPWSEIAVTLTDERWVPTSSDRSNQRLLSRTLFKGAAAGAEFVPLYSGAAEPSGALPAISASLERLVLPLSVAVLGMGEDMHTASLFPGALGLEAAMAPDAPPAAVIKAPGQPEPRITLTARVLAAAASRHILITGAAKRAALDEALDAPDAMTAPVRAVLDGAEVHYAD